MHDLKVDPPIMQSYIKIVYQLIPSLGRWFTHMYLFVLMFLITQGPGLYNLPQFDIITLILDCLEGKPMGNLVTNGTFNCIHVDSFLVLDETRQTEYKASVKCRQNVHQKCNCTAGHRSSFTFYIRKQCFRCNCKQLKRSVLCVKYLSRIIIGGLP